MTVPTRLDVPDSIYEPIPVLDHGFVRLVDFMGSDQRVVDTARLSYQKGTAKAQGDRNLLRYLFRNRHTSPFEKCVIEIEMKLPIFVVRQLVRHRTHAMNELSARYSEIPNEIYVPDTDLIVTQSKINKQLSSDEQLANADEIQAGIETSQSLSFAEYERLLESGLARERARGVLPINTYTHLSWTQNLHNLLHLLDLRLDETHAQAEFVQASKAIASFIEVLFPNTWEAFQDYVLNATFLSAGEIATLKGLFESRGIQITESTLRQNAEQHGIKGRESNELVAKFGDILGLNIT